MLLREIGGLQMAQRLEMIRLRCITLTILVLVALLVVLTTMKGGDAWAESNICVLESKPSGGTLVVERYCIDGYEYVVVQGLRGDVTIIQSRKISQNSIGGKSVELPKSCECKGGL